MVPVTVNVNFSIRAEFSLGAGGSILDATFFLRAGRPELTSQEQNEAKTFSRDILKGG